MGASAEASGERSIAAGQSIRQAVSGDASVAMYTEKSLALPAEAFVMPDRAPDALVNLPDKAALFVGRDRELGLLDTAFRDVGGVVVQAVHGLGGIGKSTLAARWAAGRTGSYNPVWWINAETPTDLDAGLADLAVALQPALRDVMSREPGAGSSGECEPDALQDMAESRGEACIRGGQLRERLGERAARTGGRAADEASDRQMDHDALPGERQILQPALVGVVHPGREAAAVRTCGTGPPASRRHVDRAESGGHRLDVHVVDPVEHERVPERCVGPHDQHRHWPRTSVTEMSLYLTERHSRLSGRRRTRSHANPGPHNRTRCPISLTFGHVSLRSERVLPCM